MQGMSAKEDEPAKTGKFAKQLIKFFEYFV